MKKTLVTLLAATTLAAAVAPVVNATSNVYTKEAQTAAATVAELGREYALAFANAASAKNAAETTAQILFSAEQNRDAVYSAENAKVEAAKAALAAANTAWQVAKENAVRGEYADETTRNAAIAAVDTEHGIKVADAEDALKAAEKAANEAKAKADKAVAEAKAQNDKAQADLAAAVAAKEAAYNKALGLGATPAQLEAAAAGTTAPVAKPAAGVKAAATPTGQKALPKTSAAK